MHYAILGRKGIIDAINQPNSISTNSCPISEIRKVANTIPEGHVLLLWENNNTGCNPVWVINDKYHKETLAYIDTYTNKYTPFTSFFRVLKSSFFDEYVDFYRKNINVDIAPLIGVIISEALSTFGVNLENPDDLSVQAYLSTLSASLVSALGKGFTDHGHLSEVAHNWEKTNSLLGLHRNSTQNSLILSFWLPIATIISSPKTSDYENVSDYLPRNIFEFLSIVVSTKKISKSDWALLVGDNEIGMRMFDGFASAREDGIKYFRKLLNDESLRSKLSEVEFEVSLATALTQISSSSMDFSHYALSLSKDFSMLPHWYALLVGITSEGAGLRTQKGIANHIYKHISSRGNIFSGVKADISAEELSVVLNDNIDIVPFITEYNSVLNIEVFPLVESKFKLNKGLMLTHGKDRDGKVLSKNEYDQLVTIIDRANKILNTNQSYKKSDRPSSTPTQGNLLDL